MMIIKVCDGLPSFLYMGEEQYLRIKELLKGIEYYEIQNMVHYMLKSEDLLRGLFPKVSLETIYINLYNISRLRDVEKILDNLERDEGENENRRPQSVPHHPVGEATQQKAKAGQTEGAPQRGYQEEAVKKELLPEHNDNNLTEGLSRA